MSEHNEAALKLAREIYGQYLERLAAERGIEVAPLNRAKILRGDCDAEHGVQIALAAYKQATPTPTEPGDEARESLATDIAVAIAERFLCQPKEMVVETRAEELTETVMFFVVSAEARATAAEAKVVELGADVTYQAKLLLEIRSKIILFVDEIEDEGDRVYFGSTNHVDYLRELHDELDEFQWSRMEKNAEGRDLYAEMRELRRQLSTAETKVAALTEALVEAAIPLEALILSGLDHLSPEMQAGIVTGAKRARAALASNEGGVR